MPKMPLIRQRALWGGESGTGKTFSWMKMAGHLPESRFFVIEADGGVLACLQEFPELNNVFVGMGEGYKFPHVDTWDDFWGRDRGVGQLKIWNENNIITPQDFVVIEGVDILYEDMRYELIDRAILGPERAKHKHANVDTMPTSWDVLIDRRKGEKPAIDIGDWDAINTEYNTAMNYLLYNLPCQLIMTCGIEEIHRPAGKLKIGDSKDLVDFYDTLGMPMKFAGWKRFPRKFDTLIQFGRNLNGYNFIVYKNRGRSIAGSNGALTPIANKDFYIDYMQKVGWG